MAPRDDVKTTRDGGAFRQPVVWLATGILVVTVAACIATIVIAVRYADTPIVAPARR
jgi:hypothetical protein